VKSRSIVWRDAVRDSDLDSTAKLVAFVLSTYMNASGLARPGRLRIAAGCSLDVRAIDRARKRLRDAGFLEYEDGHKGGAGYTLSYVARLPETVAEGHRSDWERVALRSEKGGPEAKKGGPEPPESALKRLKAVGGARLESSPPSTPEEDCSACDERKPIVDTDRWLCLTCVQAADGNASAEGAIR
jgi:hypothetical protein